MIQTSLKAFSFIILSLFPSRDKNSDIKSLFLPLTMNIESRIFIVFGYEYKMYLIFNESSIKNNDYFNSYY